jgi:hypothetical protein
VVARESLLGQGANSEVFSLGPHAVLKAPSDDAEATRAAVREVAALDLLGPHPGIIAAPQLVSKGGKTAYVYPRFEGEWHGCSILAPPACVPTTPTPTLPARRFNAVCVVQTALY